MKIQKTSKGITIIDDNYNETSIQDEQMIDFIKNAKDGEEH